MGVLRFGLERGEMEAGKVAAERGSLRERWEGRTGETKGGRVGEGGRRDRGRKGGTRNRQLGKGGGGRETKGGGARGRAETEERIRWEREEERQRGTGGRGETEDGGRE